jgi:hypothetical protein
MKLVQRWAPWVAVAVLVAGVVAFAVSRLADSPVAAPPHRPAPITAVETRIAREFIDTAVARKHLDRAWAITAPELKQGMSLEEWRTGTIAVVPYPVEQAVVRLKVASSFTDTAQIHVSFLPRTAKASAASFRLDLRKVDGTWLVSSWQPSAAVVPPKGK